MNSTNALVAAHQRSRLASSQRKAENEPRQPRASQTSSARDVPKAALTWRWWLMTAAAFVIAGWTFYFIYTQPPGLDGYVGIRNRILGNMLGVAHVGGGGIAMTLGPFQYIKTLRRTGRPSTGSPRFSAHSWIGRVYTVAVLASGVGSLDVIKKSDLYTFGSLGFIALGSAWVVTAALGWRAMWKDTADVEAHRRWMTHNFALTYAAVMLRWQLPLLLVLGVETKLALSWTGWTCWVPNLMFVDRYILPGGKGKEPANLMFK